LPGDAIIQTSARADRPKTQTKKTSTQTEKQLETQIGKTLTLKSDSNIQTYVEDTSRSLIPDTKIKVGPNKSLNKVKILQSKKIKNTTVAPAGTYYQIQFKNKKVWINSNKFN